MAWDFFCFRNLVPQDLFHIRNRNFCDEQLAGGPEIIGNLDIPQRHFPNRHVLSSFRQFFIPVITMPSTKYFCPIR